MKRILILLLFVLYGVAGFTQETGQETGQETDTLNKQSSIFFELLGRSTASLNFRKNITPHLSYHIGGGYDAYYTYRFFSFSSALEYCIGQKHQAFATLFLTSNINLTPLSEEDERNIRKMQQELNLPYGAGIPIVKTIDIYYAGSSLGYRLNAQKFFFQIALTYRMFFHYSEQYSELQKNIITIGIGYKFNRNKQK